MRQVIKPIDTRTDFKKALDDLKHEIPHQIELMGAQARIAKGQYDALIKEGFNEKQAMQILTTQPGWR